MPHLWSLFIFTEVPSYEMSSLNCGKVCIIWELITCTASKAFFCLFLNHFSQIIKQSIVRVFFYKVWEKIAYKTIFHYHDDVVIISGWPIGHLIAQLGQSIFEDAIEFICTCDILPFLDSLHELEYRIVASRSTCYYSGNHKFCFLKSRLLTCCILFLGTKHLCF